MKNLQKVIQKGGKNEEKTLKKSMWEKAWVLDAPRGMPEPTPEPNKHNKSQQETHKPSTQTQQWAKKVSEEGCVKKGESKPLTRLGRLQARSGYIGAKGRSGYPAKRGTKLGILGGFSTGTWHPDTIFTAKFRYQFSDAVFSSIFRMWIGFWIPFWMHFGIILHTGRISVPMSYISLWE